jgi:hypothetical protein
VQHNRLHLHAGPRHSVVAFSMQLHCLHLRRLLRPHYVGQGGSLLHMQCTMVTHVMLAAHMLLHTRTRKTHTCCFLHKNAYTGCRRLLQPMCCSEQFSAFDCNTHLAAGNL